MGGTPAALSGAGETVIFDDDDDAATSEMSRALVVHRRGGVVRSRSPIEQRPHLVARLRRIVDALAP